MIEVGNFITYIKSFGIDENDMLGLTFTIKKVIDVKEKYVIVEPNKKVEKERIRRVYSNDKGCRKTDFHLYDEVKSCENLINGTWR